MITESIHANWKLLRAEGNEDSTALDLTTKGNFANKPSTAVQLTPNTGYGNGVQNLLEVAACCGAAANKTFTMTLFGWRAENGMAKRICSVACTAGTQAVIAYPHSAAVATNKFWADTMVVTSYWPLTIYDGDNAGGDAVASLILDLTGYEYIYAEISGADGTTGAEAANVSVYYSYV